MKAVASMWELELKDFGPIQEGRVILRPLTIFIGANNTGKSYMAQVAYALGRLSSIPPTYARFSFPPLSINLTELDRKSFETLAGLRRRKEPVRLDQLPESIRASFEKWIETFFTRVERRAAQELLRCFGVTVAQELVRQGKESFSIGLSQTHPLVRVKLELRFGRVELTEKEWNREIELKDPEDFAEPPDTVLIVAREFDFLYTRAYHLPAARSGILQGHKALASSILRQLPLVGIERLEIPSLPGVVADFLAELLTIGRPRREPAAAEVADFLEAEICKGHIELERTQPEAGYPELYYRQGPLRLPLHRTSSMVSELAPIVLFLRYVIAKDDLLIIEEPEAHLHPDHQLALARGIGRLVRHGVRVLVTTHSDYFLHQISNLVQASAADDKTRDWSEEQLKAEEVGVYLFKVVGPEAGTTVEQLEVTAEEGIPQDEFVRIAEELYDETVRLERAWSGRR
jgi:predicted ATPase